jgi:phytoene dehydrogenase-like protein
MSLFFDILSSINHTEQRGDIEQLTAVAAQAEQLAAQHNLDASTLQALVTGLGRSMQSTLKTMPQPEPHGMGEIVKMGQLSQWLPDQNPPVHSSPQAAANQAIWTADRQKILIREIAQQTGVTVSLVESMLPSLLGLILGLLNMGTIKSMARVTNPLLNRFRDDQGNLGDVLRLSDRFLQGI